MLLGSLLRRRYVLQCFLNCGAFGKVLFQHLHHFIPCTIVFLDFDSSHKTFACILSTYVTQRRCGALAQSWVVVYESFLHQRQRLFATYPLQITKTIPA